MIGFVFGIAAVLAHTIMWFFMVGTGESPEISTLAIILSVLIHVLAGIVPFYLGWATRGSFGGGASAIEITIYLSVVAFGSTLTTTLMQNI